MFKQFYLNSNYSFAITGECQFKNNTIFSNEKLIEIEISGKNYLLSKEWLGLICHYETKLPFNEMSKIHFVDCVSDVLKIRCRKLMIFKSPIKYDEEFRIIPGFPAFAINSKGIVLSLKKNRKILKEAIGPYGYPYVNVYDPDKSKWRSVVTHLLLARTFILNNNPSEKVYVNHKDGNKLNRSLLNLEWVTPSENNVHAFANDLRTDNLECKVRNVFTKEIIIFSSVSEAYFYMGFKSRSKPINRLINDKVVPYLRFGKFEIKLLNDKSPWYYDSKEKIEQRYKVNGPFQAKSVETGVVLEEDTIVKLSKITGVSRFSIEHAVKSLIPKLYKSYIFRIKSDLPWPINYQLPLCTKRRKIKIINIKTGQEKTFKSSSKLRLFLGIDKRTLKLRLLSKKPYKEWFLEELK